MLSQATASVPYTSIRGQLQTGDLLSFQGTSPVDFMIDILEEGTYSHVGMVLRDSSGSLFFWDAPGIPDHLPDPFNGNKPNPGCRVADLDDLLAEYMNEMKLQQFTWRQLRPTLSASQIATLMAFVQQVDSTLFPGTNANIPPVIERWFNSNFPASKGLLNINVGLLISYLNGTVLQTPEPNSFFCAQLAAQSYMALGLLPFGPFPSNGYDPGNFNDQPTPLKLLQGARLAAPVLISWDQPVRVPSPAKSTTAG